MPRADGQRADDRARPERRGEPAEPGLSDPVDVFGHIRQQPEEERIGEQVDEEGEGEGAEQLGLGPHVALLQPGEQALGGGMNAAPATPSDSRKAATYIALTMAYTGPMPMSATPAVPAAAPTTRALSEVVREIPSARMSSVTAWSGPQHVAHHVVRGPQQAGDGGDGEHARPAGLRSR